MNSNTGRQSKTKEATEDRAVTPCPSTVLSKDHPCYGCGNYGTPCVGICTKELLSYLEERRKKNREAGHC